MKNLTNDDLVRLLADEETSFRMLALNFLSEGYADDERVMTCLLAGWDRWGPELAFPELPLISHLCVPPERIAECCQRAARMAQGRKLTEFSARCGGKLMEQMVRLPAVELRPHIETISEVCSRSKIFFRVAPASVRQRIQWLDLEADALAGHLDNAIEQLAVDASKSAAFQQGLQALEMLRFNYPETLDLAKLLSQSPPDDGPQAVGFQLAMHSLIQWPQADLESVLAPHLADSRQAIQANATEALVRAGTASAAAHLIAQFPGAELTTQRWLARGLQRLRANGLADEVAQLRATTDDPTVWVMLLVAEVRQIDERSMQRIIRELPRVQLFSGTLLDALNVYARIHEFSTDARAMQQTYMTYLQRVNQGIREKLEEKLRASASKFQD